MRLRCYSKVMKDSSVTFCQETSAHGFTHVINRDKRVTLRAFYAIVLVLASLMILYQSGHSVAALANKTMTTEITEIYQNGGMVFPQIHICDPKFFQVDKIKQLGVDNELASYTLLSTSRHVIARDLQGNPQRAEELKNKFSTFMGNNSFTLKTFLDNIMLTCKDIIAGCEKDTQTWSAESCCREFFENVTTFTAFGTCISTIPKRIVQQFESRDDGFIVYIRPYTKSQLIDFDTTIVKSSTVMSPGVLYAVKRDIVPVSAAMETAGIFAPINAWVLNMITTEVRDNTNLKDNMLAPHNCADPNDSRYLPLAPNYDRYSSDRCMSDAQQSYWHKTSNCSLVSLAYKGKKYPLCEPWQVVESLTNDANNTFMTQLNINNTQCIKNCFVQAYKMTTSAGQMKQNLEENEYLVLNFFFPSFYYNVLTNYPYTWLKWLGEIGGNLGLFMGASIITILEIILYFLECCFPLKIFSRKEEENLSRVPTLVVDPLPLSEKSQSISIDD